MHTQTTRGNRLACGNFDKLDHGTPAPPSNYRRGRTYPTIAPCYHPRTKFAQPARTAGTRGQFSQS
jgi:hypothetical protein